ncbi:MAG: F0F1 ATP synthase subunit delta [Candidatus Omnitrophota bacterium]
MVWSLILIQVITFGVIIAVLRLLFGSQLKVALNRLQVLHQDSLEKEEILNKEIERVRVQSESEIVRSKEEAKRIIENARHSAEKITLEASEHAEQQAKKTIVEALEKAKKAEAEMMVSAEEKAVALAQELITCAFSTKGQELLHAQLIDDLIEELKKVDKTRLAVKVDTVEVFTPLQLSPQEEAKIEEILASKLSFEFKIAQKIEPSLIVGMVIKLGGLVIDGSLKNKMAKAMNALRMSRA